MQSMRFIRTAAGIAVMLAVPALAAVVPPAGYLYSPQILGSLTQSCVAVGPGGTFVAIGPGFKANAQAVVLVPESGAARLVALGFNSVADCVYDAASDTLYVSDNAGSTELPTALTGDTVFRIPSASTASGLPAKGLELIPANGIPAAAGLAVDVSGNVYVGDSTGGGAGKVLKITLPAATSAPFASGLDLSAGLAFDSGGDLFVAETRSGSFDSQIRRYDPLGASLGVFAGPSYGFGSYDLAFDSDGQLLATGAYGGDVVSFNPSAVSSPFAGGLTFATGVSVNSFTGRVEILSSTFIPTDEDRSIHRFTPIDHLVPGRGAADTECLHEFYGAALVPQAPGELAKKAICTDGDACDADGVENDRCVFPIGFCLNVPDPSFPDCTASVSSFSWSVKPNPLDASSALAALSASLPSTAASCFFSDGVTVPVKQTAAGKKPGNGSVKTKATSAGGDIDADTLLLVCNPAP